MDAGRWLGERIQGEGRFLVPGFWDMHVHAVDPFSSEGLPLFVANGVTGVRDMWGDFEVEREEMTLPGTQPRHRGEPGPARDTPERARWPVHPPRPYLNPMPTQE